MLRNLTGFLSAVCIIGAGAPAFAITVEIAAPSSRHVAQGQMFYSRTVSRVSNGTTEACMVSTGSNWRDDGEARRATEFGPLIANGATFQSALSNTEPVSLKSLRSNTPFLAFVVDDAGRTIVRIGAGFEITRDSARISANRNAQDLSNIAHEIEKRGDTLKIADSAVASQMLKEFFAGKVFHFAAQSRKSFSGGTEHVLQYEFNGVDDRAAFSNCIADMGKPDRELKVSSHAQFTLKPVQDQTIQDRMMARAMACNRDLDPQGAEVMEFDGPILGFSTPLAYALVRRDGNGKITDIWSGDFWRATDRGSGLMIAFSNSITRQGPLDPQFEKACTRLGDMRPVFLGRDDGGVLGVATDFNDALRLTGISGPGIGPSLSGTPKGPVPPGGTPRLPSPVPKPPVSEKIRPPDEDPKPKQGGEENPNVVPVPSAVWLLVAAFASFFAAGRWGTKSSG